MAKEYRLSIIVTGKDSGASSMLTGIGGSLRSIGTIAGGILTSQVFTAIASQIGNMASSAFNAVSQFQSMQMMLTNLQARELIRTGDFEDMNAALAAAGPLAEATMDQLERIATLSPYQLENVSNTYKMAMAFGFTAKESTVFTDALLNMAAGVGANGEMLDRMAYNLAQVRMQGKVTAMDIRQLAMAGFDLVDVLKYTGKQMGVNIETHEDFNRAIAAGQISWADFTKYFAEYADKNFGGAAERMSRTLEGLKSTFKDVFMLTMPKLLGPLADKVTGYLNDVLNSFMKFADSGVLEQMGQDLANFFDSPFFQNGLLGLTRGFEHWAQNVDWEQISQDLAAGIDSIDWVTLGEKVREGAGNIANGIREMLTEIDWSALATSSGNAFMDFMAGLTNQGSWENVKAVWRSNFQQLGDIVTTSLQIIKDRSIVESALIGAGIPVALQVGFGSNVGGLYLIFWQMSDEIVFIIQELKKAFIAEFNNIIDAAKRVIEERAIEIYQAISELIELARSALKPIEIQVMLPDFESLKAIAVEKLIEILTAGKNAIKPFVYTVILPAWEWLKEKVTEGANALYQAGKKALKAISVIVGLPDWEALAREIEEGMAILNGAMKGGVKGGSIGSKGSTKMRAAGGPVKADEAYMVGERGRELFVPDRNGYIVPNHKVENMGGALMPAAGGGGSTFNVTVVYAPPISFGTEREARDNIAPIVVEAVRTEFQKRGF